MIKGLITLFLINILYILSKNSSKKCRILSLQGGGDRGAYQVGAFKALVDNLPGEEIQYDIYSGISVGSMNSAVLSFFKKGEEKNASDLLLKNWRNITSYKDIYRNYNFLGILYSFFNEKGLYDTSPLKSLLSNLLENHEIQRNITIGMTNLNTGKYEVFSNQINKNMSKQDELLAILSSSAIPVTFPHILFNNNSYVDGNIGSKVDTTSGISICRDLGYADEDIIMDIIMLSIRQIPKIEPKLNPLSSALRAFEILFNDIFIRELDELSHVFPNVKIRYVITPTRTLASGNIPIYFQPDQIENMIQQGYNEAVEVIKKGEGESFRKMRKMYVKSKYEKMYGTVRSKKFLS
jgi:predicted patatin/cPLA2 family phospholipase